eukprot:gene2922-1904_t
MSFGIWTVVIWFDYVNLVGIYDNLLLHVLVLVDCDVGILCLINFDSYVGDVYLVCFFTDEGNLVSVILIMFTFNICFTMFLIYTLRFRLTLFSNCCIWVLVSLLATDWIDCGMNAVCYRFSVVYFGRLFRKFG